MKSKKKVMEVLWDTACHWSNNCKHSEDYLTSYPETKKSRNAVRRYDKKNLYGGNNICINLFYNCHKCVMYKLGFACFVKPYFEICLADLSENRRFTDLLFSIYYMLETWTAREYREFMERN